MGFTGGKVDRSQSFRKLKHGLPLSLLQYIKPTTLAYVLLPAFSVLGGFHSFWQILSSSLFLLSPKMLLMYQSTHAVDGGTCLCTLMLHVFFWSSTFMHGGAAGVLSAFALTVCACHLIEFPMTLLAQHYTEDCLGVSCSTSWDEGQVYRTVNFLP